MLLVSFLLSFNMVSQSFMASKLSHLWRWRISRVKWIPSNEGKRKNGDGAIAVLRRSADGNLPATLFGSFLTTKGVANSNLQGWPPLVRASFLVLAHIYH